MEALAKFRGSLFVDVGANAGVYCLRLAHNFQKVYAFEPNPSVLPILRKRIEAEAMNNVTVFPIALSNVTGQFPFFTDAHEGFDGSVETLLPVFKYNPGNDSRAGPMHTYVGEKNVPVHVDTYDNQIDEIADLVKIDVEGAEFQVLMGAKKSLSNGRIRRIMVELHDADAKKQLIDILSSYGFAVKELDSHPRFLGILQK